MTNLPPMETLSLNDPPEPRKSWDDLPGDVEGKVWDSIKSGDRGCQESRNLCNKPLNKRHGQWCRDNAQWLYECDLMRIPVDESKLTGGLSLSNDEREVVQRMRGVILVPTSAQSALMNAPLMRPEVIRLLRLAPMPGPSPRFRDGRWYVSPLAPGYKFCARYFPMWNSILASRGNPALDQKYMVFVTKQ